MKPFLLDFSLSELEAEVENLGQPAFRARVVWNWVYRLLAVSFEEMTDLPEEVRQRLEAKFCLSTLKLLEEMVSATGQTTKVLFRLEDGRSVEAVSMLYPPSRGNKARHSICLSSQVGCPIGCPFCATGQQGFERDLTPGEVVEQALHLIRRVGRDSATNVVFMGMGEPLLNYDAVVKAIRILNSPQGLRIGARGITVSTAGVPSRIRDLAGEGLQVGLAVSLHAPDNDLRRRLVPLNKRYPLEELIPACKKYFAVTGRRVTFEYVLFDSVNDSLEQAGKLAGLLKGMGCHVNLIPANSACGPFGPPSEKRLLEFQAALRSLGVACTVRQSLGADIQAGCGQLRSRHETVEQSLLP